MKKAKVKAQAMSVEKFAELLLSYGLLCKSGSPVSKERAACATAMMNAYCAALEAAEGGEK